MTTRWGLIVAALAAAPCAPAFAAHGGATAYPTGGGPVTPAQVQFPADCPPTAYREVPRTTYQTVNETVMRPVTETVCKPVVETVCREETYTVPKVVYETVMKPCQYTG